MKKYPHDTEAATQLPGAYDRAVEVRKSSNVSNYNNLSRGDRWMEISSQPQVTQQMHDRIKSVPAAGKE